MRRNSPPTPRPNTSPVASAKKSIRSASRPTLGWMISMTAPRIRPPTTIRLTAPRSNSAAGMTRAANAIMWYSLSTCVSQVGSGTGTEGSRVSAKIVSAIRAVAVRLRYRMFPRLGMRCSSVIRGGWLGKGKGIWDGNYLEIEAK